MGKNLLLSALCLDVMCLIELIKFMTFLSVILLKIKPFTLTNLWLVSMCFLDLNDVYNFLFILAVVAFETHFLFLPALCFGFMCEKKNCFILTVLLLGSNLVHTIYSYLIFSVGSYTKKNIRSTLSSLMLECYSLTQFNLVIIFYGTFCTEKTTPLAILLLYYYGIMIYKIIS